VTLSPSGELLWAASAGGAGLDMATAVAVDENGSVLIAGRVGARADLDPGPGRVEVAPVGPADAFLVAFGADGGHRWTRLIGGSGEDAASGLALDAGGTPIVVGEFRGRGRLVPGGDVHDAARADAFVVALPAP